MAEQTVVSDSKYTREALMASKKYRQQCDILAIVLEEEKEYTLAEVDKAIEDFLKKPVKEEINGKEE